jgi:hypothetical protein
MVKGIGGHPPWVGKPNERFGPHRYLEPTGGSWGGSSLHRVKCENCGRITTKTREELQRIKHRNTARCIYEIIDRK